MTNAKEEFLGHIGTREVEFVSIKYGSEYSRSQVEIEGSDIGLLSTALDFTYDSGYGGQRLFGCIWYTDGSWSARGEYDGSEWWEHRVRPPIPSLT